MYTIYTVSNPNVINLQVQVTVSYAMVDLGKDVHVDLIHQTMNFIALNWINGIPPI